MEPKDSCVALVSKRAYLDKALLTIWQLLIFGRFKGDVVLVVGDDLRSGLPALRKSLPRLTPVYFPDIDRNLEDSVLENAPTTLDSQSKKELSVPQVLLFLNFFQELEQSSLTRRKN